ncbi:hypothetical protein [Paenibacillus illinoisensis]
MLVDGHHPPIIRKDLWDKVQLLRKKKETLPKKRFEGNSCLLG